MSPFYSFWQAGFEGADHINPFGQRLSMNEINNHLTQYHNDYAALQQFGMKSVRESIGWRLTEMEPEATFASLKKRMNSARSYGLQINGTFCHYGWPDDLTLFSPEFLPRFAAFCQRIAAWLVEYYEDAPIYSPMNEISFMAWGISVGLFGNNAQTDPDEIKRQLIRATLAGCAAIHRADPRALFLHCDPIIHVVPDEDSDNCRQRTAEINASQYQA